jgi:hypothetical protein
MPAVRDVLKHVRVESAKRKRKCNRNAEHVIAAGEPCLVIRNDDGLGSKNYCSACAAEIVKRACKELDSITRTLGRESSHGSLL